MGCVSSKSNSAGNSPNGSEKKSEENAAPVPKSMSNQSMAASGATGGGYNVPIGVCKEMRVSFDFEGNEQNETLSVKKNELVIVLDESDENWFLVRNRSGAEGYVPMTYLTANVDVTLSEGWFFERINRTDANHLLNQHGKVGGFLVRKAQSKSGYSLSIFTPERLVKHYIINNVDSKFYINEQYVFNSVQELVKSYQRQNLGICCQLTSYPEQVAPTVNSLAKDVWEVPRESIQLFQQLGHGQFGEVWMGIYNNTQNVAVKTLKPGSMTPEAFLEEADIMKKLRHPKLVQLLAVCSKGEPLYIITEFMKGGSLLSYLKNHKDSLDTHTLIDFGAQVAEGMAYLEKNNFIHRDLAARNVLVGEGNVCKVADFGLARVIDDSVYSAASDSKFPVKWTAPEAAIQSLFTIKSDVWSYGILLYEIFSFGGMPYPKMNNTEALHKILGGYRMPCPAGCPEAVHEIMEECWNQDPSERPTFDFLTERMSNFCDAADARYR